MKMICFVFLVVAGTVLAQRVPGQESHKTSLSSPLDPDFRTNRLVYELRNIRADYWDLIPFPLGAVTNTMETIWTDSVSRGYSETTTTGRNWSSGTLFDWRVSPATVYHTSGGNLVGSEPLADYTTNEVMRAEHANVGLQGEWPWTWRHTADYYVTPTNTDRYCYVYKLAAKIMPHSGGHPVYDRPYFPEAPYDRASVKVGGISLNEEGFTYLPMQPNYAYHVTPRCSTSSWYRFSVDAAKFNAVGPYLVGAGTLEPSSVMFPGRFKQQPIGVGYDPHLLEAVAADAGTLSCGQLVTNRGYLCVLSYLWVQTPKTVEFMSGWNWHQDVSTRTDVYDPQIYDWRVIPHAFKRFRGNSPPFAGNDPQALADVTPDAAFRIYNADAPGFLTDHPALAWYNKGAILKWSFAARTWPTWKGGIVAYIQRWNFSITLKKTSDRDVRPATWQPLLVFPVHYGDSPESLTLAEAKSYFPQPL